MMIDSDSDDDDLLLVGSTFGNSRSGKRSERAGDKARAKGLAYLDEGLKEDEKRRNYQEKIIRIKEEQTEECCDEEMLTQAENQARETKRFKATHNAIHGIDEEMAGIEGSDKLVTALETSQTKMLGTRSMLGRGDRACQWMSMQDAMDKLADAVNRFQSNKSYKNKAFQKELVSVLQSAIKDRDMLVSLLERQSLVRLCHRHGVAHLPHEITEWLYCLACKAVFRESENMSEGAFQTLISMLDVNDGVHNVLRLSDLEDGLQRTWFGLGGGVNTKTSVDNETNSSSQVSRVDVNGLERFLRLWERAFLLNYVSMDNKTGSSEETATQIMVTLARAGLDPCIHRFESLMEALTGLIRAFLDHVERNVPDSSRWVESTSISMLDVCRSLGLQATDIHEDHDHEHHEDHEFWLCTSLMVRTMAMLDQLEDSPPNGLCKQLGATMAIQALSICLGKEQDWDQHLQSVLSTHKDATLTEQASNSLRWMAEQASISLRWKAIASGFAGFLTIPTLGDGIMRNGQRCLATVENIRSCLVLGIHMGEFPSTDNDDSNPQEKSPSNTSSETKEARHLFYVLELLEVESRALEKRASTASRDHIFGRAERHLSWMRSHLDSVKKVVRQMAGVAGPVVSKQKGIQDFFGATSAAMDEDDEDDDEGIDIV